MHLADGYAGGEAIDKEWIELMAAAKKIGLTILEIKSFLAQGKNENVNKPEEFYNPSMVKIPLSEL